MSIGLAASAVSSSPQPGEALIRQGVTTRDLFFVLDGATTVEVKGVGKVAKLGSGEIMGEMSFVDRAPPYATVIAGSTCVLPSIDKRDMDAPRRGDAAFDARFRRALAMVLSDRLRAMSGAASGALDEDELDESGLDQLSSAGLRFDAMLKKLLAVS